MRCSECSLVPRRSDPRPRTRAAARCHRPESHGASGTLRRTRSRIEPALAAPPNAHVLLSPPKPSARPAAPRAACRPSDDGGTRLIDRSGGSLHRSSRARMRSARTARIIAPTGARSRRTRPSPEIHRRRTRRPRSARGDPRGLGSGHPTKDHSGREPGLNAGYRPASAAALGPALSAPRIRGTTRGLGRLSAPISAAALVASSPTPVVVSSSSRPS